MNWGRIRDEINHESINYLPTIDTPTLSLLESDVKLKTNQADVFL